MFSRTTMELSTSIPMPKRSPIMEIRFIVSPLKYIRNRVIITEIGMASPIMIVLFMERKNINNTAIARSAPCITDFTTSAMVCSITSVVFEVSMSSTSEGSSACSCFSTARTFLAAVTEFLPLCFCRLRSTQGEPFI